MAESPLKQAQRIATEGLSFLIPAERGLFPPLAVANSFFACGYDDLPNEEVLEWEPFELSEEEYRSLFEWWEASHPGSRIDWLGLRSPEFSPWFSAAVRQPRKFPPGFSPRSASPGR